jgi:geranylgeranyl diphosphate synthase type II
MIGAVLGGASFDDVKKIEKAGSDVGIAFQIQDDILDIEGDEAVLGKPIGSDERNEKSTYVTFKGIEKSKEEVKRLTDEAIEILKKLPYENEFLVDLLQYLVYRDN